MSTMSQATWKDLVKGAVENGSDSAKSLREKLVKDLNSLHIKYNAVITTTTTKNDGSTNWSYNGELFYANVQYDGWTYRAFLTT